MKKFKEYLMILIIISTIFGLFGIVFGGGSFLFGFIFGLFLFNALYLLDYLIKTIFK